jgi:hypothetical protein
LVQKKQEVLSALGFNRSETKVLETLFRVGPSTVNFVSKNAGIDRAETYRVVVRLQEKGYLQKVYDYPMKVKAVPMCDLFSLQIHKRKEEIVVLEKEAKRLIELEGSYIRPLESEYITLLPQAEKAFEEICREIKSVKRKILIASSVKNFVTMKQMPWGNIYKPLLDKGIEVIQVLTEPYPKGKFPDPYNYARYPNYSLRCTLGTDDILPQVDLVIHDNEKVWLKICGMEYDKSSWIFSNNPNMVALAKY